MLLDGINIRYQRVKRKTGVEDEGIEKDYYKFMARKNNKIEA